ncbi:MAG: N-glycosylase/DNA lyase [Methanolobus sp.]|nr:N-glycosylase/DNA lyase [Methanolobus sp.]
MYTLFCENFNLDYTLDCGQVFRWDLVDGWWTGVLNGHVARLQQDKISGEVFVDCPLPKSFFENYFRFDDDLDSILQEVNKDEFMDEAISKYMGLRLIRQDPWECLISYMLATAWSIPNIKRAISMMCQNYGKEHVEDGNLILDDIFKVDYEEAKQRLMFLEGIGEKVADCILLFAFDKMEAFPVDTHVEKVVKTVYGHHEYFNGNATKSKIGNWGRMYFGPYCGYAQQYFFYQKRLEGL